MNNENKMMLTKTKMLFVHKRFVFECVVFYSMSALV